MQRGRWKPPLWRNAAFLAAVVAASGLSAGPAGATIVNPGGGAKYPGATGLTPDPPAVTNLNGTSEGAFVIGSTSTVTSNPDLTSWTVNAKTAVFRNGDNTLSFYYQFTKLSGTTEPHRFTMDDFTGFTTDIGFRTDAVVTPDFTFTGGGDNDAGFNPNLADGAGGPPGSGDDIPIIGPLQDFTWADRSASGGTVGFNFDQPFGNDLNTGESTVTMVIRTNATQFQSGFYSAINGGVAFGPSFAPLREGSNVPEPASLALAAAGLAPLAGLLKRRRRSSETEETDEVA